MDTFLEKLFDKYEIVEKDRYEILSIYSLLPDFKKQSILDNFDSLAIKLKTIREDKINEEEIILDNIIPDIEKIIEENKTS